MAWFRKEKKPRPPRAQRLEIPPDVWEKCEACGHTDIREKFERNANVCPSCDHHRRIRAHEYVSLLLDEGTIDEKDVELGSVDPLEFPDYPARLKKALKSAGEHDAILTVSGTMDTMPVNLGVMDFAFMGGSMGSVVGEKIARLGQRSLEKKWPLIVISSSGGARMQEGVNSLFQMAKTTAALQELAKARLPFVSLLTDPTMGGVSASFAFVADLVIAEPGALIGFAGPRVIEQTVREKLPEGFQRAEFLVEKGAVDLIVDRRQMKDKLAQLLALLQKLPAAA